VPRGGALEPAQNVKIDGQRVGTWSQSPRAVAIPATRDLNGVDAIVSAA